MIIAVNDKGDTFLFNKRAITYAFLRKADNTLFVHVKGEQDMVRVESVEQLTYNSSQQHNSPYKPCDEQLPIKELMAKKIIDLDIDIPVLWVRFVNACKQNDIETLGQLMKVSPHDIERSRNCGAKSVSAVRDALRERYNIDW